MTVPAREQAQGPFPTPTHAAQHWYDRAKAAEAELALLRESEAEWQRREDRSIRAEAELARERERTTALRNLLDYTSAEYHAYAHSGEYTRVRCAHSKCQEVVAALAALAASSSADTPERPT